MINDWEDTGSTGSSFYVQPARMIYIDAAGLICTVYLARFAPGVACVIYARSGRFICVTRPARFILWRHV